MGVQISGDTGNVLATKGTYTGNVDSWWCFNI